MLDESHTIESIGEYAFRQVPLVIYDGNARTDMPWGAKKVQKSDGTVLYESPEEED